MNKMGVIGHRGGTDCTCHPPGNPSVIGASGCPIHGMRALRLEVESLRRQHQGAVEALRELHAAGQARWVIVPRPMTGEPALAYPADMDLSGLFDADRIEVVPASQLKGAVEENARLREALDAIRRDDFDREVHPSAAALAGYVLHRLGGQ